MNFSMPFDNMGYLGSAAAGGYVSSYLMSKMRSEENMDLLGYYMVSSALAGGAGGYLWLLLVSGADKSTMWKGALVGAGAQWLWNKYLSSYFMSA